MANGRAFLVPPYLFLHSTSSSSVFFFQLRVTHRVLSLSVPSSWVLCISKGFVLDVSFLDDSIALSRFNYLKQLSLDLLHPDLSHSLCNSQSTNAHSSGWIVLKSCLSFPLNSLHFGLFITLNDEKILWVMYSCNMEASYFLSCILPNLFLPLPDIENPSLLLFLNTYTPCSCLCPQSWLL